MYRCLSPSVYFFSSYNIQKYIFRKSSYFVVYDCLNMIFFLTEKGTMTNSFFFFGHK